MPLKKLGRLVFSSTINHTLIATLIGTALLTGILAFVAASHISWRSSLERQRSYESLLSLERLTSTLRDAETGQRGYLLTGNDAYLAPYRSAMRLAANRLARIRQFEFLAGPLVATLEQHTEDKLGELQQTVDLYAAGQTADALALVRSNRGKQAMDEVRATITRLQDQENARLAFSDANLRYFAALAGGIGAVTTATFVAGLVWLTLRNLAEERAHALTKQAQMLAEEKFVRVVELAPNAVVLAGKDGVINFWNQAATKMFGADMLGHPLVDLMPTRYHDRHRHWFGHANQAGALRSPGREFKLEAKRTDGVEFDIELALDRIEVGQEPLYVALIRDVTDRYRVLRELERSNEELDQFAYVASHDLQEPLRMICTFLGRLGERHGEHLDDQGRRYIELATEASSRMQRLIRDLLEYARVTTKAKALEWVNLLEVVSLVVADFQDKIAEERADIRVSEFLPKVMADPVQIRQVFQNLVGNALKYHRPGVPPTIRINVVAEATCWQLMVADNGIGIDPGDNRKIFTLFSRLHARDEYEGTGIGLAICKKIVERHQGKIWFEKVPSGGTAFYFTLPRDSRG